MIFRELVSELRLLLHATLWDLSVTAIPRNYPEAEITRKHMIEAEKELERKLKEHRAEIIRGRKFEALVAREAALKAEIDRLNRQRIMSELHLRDVADEKAKLAPPILIPPEPVAQQETRAA